MTEIMEDLIEAAQNHGSAEVLGDPEGVELAAQNLDAASQKAYNCITALGGTEDSHEL